MVLDEGEDARDGVVAPGAQGLQGRSMGGAELVVGADLGNDVSGGDEKATDDEGEEFDQGVSGWHAVRAGCICEEREEVKEEGNAGEHTV